MTEVGIELSQPRAGQLKTRLSPLEICFEDFLKHKSTACFNSQFGVTYNLQYNKVLYFMFIAKGSYQFLPIYCTLV